MSRTPPGANGRKLRLLEARLNQVPPLNEPRPALTRSPVPPPSQPPTPEAARTGGGPSGTLTPPAASFRNPVARAAQGVPVASREFSSGSDSVASFTSGDTASPVQAPEAMGGPSRVYGPGRPAAPGAWKPGSRERSVAAATAACLRPATPRAPRAGKRRGRATLPAAKKPRTTEAKSEDALQRSGRVARELAFASPEPGGYQRMRDMIDRLKEENTKLAAENEDLRAMREVVAEQVSAIADEHGKMKAEHSRIESRRVRDRQVISRALCDSARAVREKKRSDAAAQSEKLGRLATERKGTALTEVWVDGTAFQETQQRLREIAEQREGLEKQRKELARTKSQTAPRADICADRQPSTYMEEVEEVYRLQAAALRKEESTLRSAKSALVMQRDSLIRELTRQKDEMNSRFGNFPVLQGRYLLLDLLGRGGFSEVFRAFDSNTSSFVACKVHQLASNWSEARKQTFLRHMLRENDIHRSLDHHCILQAHESFELDALTVVTVLDLCQGTDLDVALRKRGPISEREARSIISQLFSALVYLDEHDIVHYDLKPGNILLENGHVKLTDFGLSKINNESAPDGMMDLTSQGAGTMWYLPPECFLPRVLGQTGPRISSKVDVWSAGVILYQCLFGCKPFGNSLTQEQFYRNTTCAKEELQFPSKPAVSDKAKDFIRACLTRSVADRLDVHSAASHPFLSVPRR